jgi:hypothetical protein
MQFCLTPKCDKDGKLRDSHYFDIDRVMKVSVPDSQNEFVTKAKPVPPGGLQDNTPSTG